MFSFGKNRRILRRADFLRVQAEGERATSRHFVFLVAKGDQEKASRLGVVVTRKIGNAVVRNRIKRLCRECFRLWPDFVPDGIDLVVIGRAGAGELGLAAVQAEWSRARTPLLARCKAALKKEGTA